MHLTLVSRPYLLAIEFREVNPAGRTPSSQLLCQFSHPVHMQRRDTTLEVD